MMHFSSMFVFMFLGLFAVSFYLMQHLINIEFNCKDSIKLEAESKLSQVDALVELYKKQSSIDFQDLGAILKTKLMDFKKSPNSTSLYNELKGSPYFIDEIILNNSSNINVDDVTNSATSPIILKIQNNIKNLDSTVTLNTDKQRDIFRNWKRMSLISAYDELNTYVATAQNTVDGMLSQLPINKNTSNIIIDKSKLPLDNPTELNRKFKPNFTVSFISILLVHCFILIPFFTTKIRGYSTSKKDTKQTNQNSGSIEI